MPDNVTLNPGAGGTTVSTEDIGSNVQMERTKIVTGDHGADGGNVTVANPFPVQLSDGVATVSPATSAKQDSVIAGLATLNSLVPTVYDYIALSYTGKDLTTVVYKIGGVGGTVVSTLSMAYISGVLMSVTKT